MREKWDELLNPRVVSLCVCLCVFCSFILMLDRQHQALIECPSVADASTLLSNVQSAPVFVNGRQVHFNFSKVRHKSALRLTYYIAFDSLSLSLLFDIYFALYRAKK